MKTSLLLMGLALGAGCLGVARAAPATIDSQMPGLGNQTLVATSMSSHGVLSALGSLLSGKSQANDGAQAGNSSPRAASGKSRHHQPLGPASVPATGQRTSAAADGAGTHPSSTAVPGSGQTPSDSAPPDLGWQSLLPGSIQ